MAESLKARALRAGGDPQTLAELLGDLPVARVARVAGVHRDTLRYHLRGRSERGAYRSTIEAVQGAVERLQQQKSANISSDGS